VKIDSQHPAPISSASQTLATPWRAITLTVGLTCIAWVESLPVTPWAPFIALYACATIVVPLRLRTVRLGEGARSLCRHWLPVLLTFVGAVIYLIAFRAAYLQVLVAYGVESNPLWDQVAAMNGILSWTVERFDAPAAGVALVLFTVLWAPIGEELFYRGFLFEVLASRWGFWLSALLSAVLLGSRHFVHFAHANPFPWGAGAAWALSTVPIGIALAWLYRRTDSIVPCMIVHFLLNVPR